MRQGRGKATKTLALVGAARNVLEQIQPASVRAVCYQLFVQGVIGSMAKAETNKVSTQLTWARENDIIPWAWIVDETRKAECVNAWKDPAEYVQTVKRSYRRDRWTQQPCRIEVWSEKGTVRGTLAPVLESYGITFRVMHGYTSSTTAHMVAGESLEDLRHLTALYVGDYDPSGLHMSEVDLPRRLERYGGEVEIIRVALTSTDIMSSTLPSFATETKQKDPRYGWYLNRTRSARCWELDALSPAILRDRVEEAIRERLDVGAWNAAGITEHAEIESLSSILNNWPGISGQASI